MTDPAQLPIGSRHLFRQSVTGEERVFKRVPGGWNGKGVFTDDLDFSDAGWVWVQKEGEA